MATENIDNRPILEITQDRFLFLLDNLVSQIKYDNWDFSAIVALPKGGLVPATYLSHKFNEKPLLTPADMSPMKDRQEHERYLILDDVIDRGNTILSINHMIGSQDRIACLVVKPWALKLQWTSIKYYSMMTVDWVKFPWEIK